LTALSASIALADDFKTIKGKEYKNATVTRVEPDGIVIRYKSGISKIFFAELPGEVADKWLAPVIAAKKAAEEKRIEAQKTAERERAEKERERAEKEREREEKEKTAVADLWRAAEEFQAAEQRASEAYRTSPKGTLSGQVFVSSREGENFKLGAVQVGLFARDAIDTLLTAAKKQADIKIQQLSPPVGAAKDEYQKILASRDFYYSGAFYFGLLLDPIHVTESDADGRFAIEVPKTGTFVIAAKAQRTVGEYTEHYYWLQPVSLEGEQQLTQNLSNNNLTSTTGTSSLIVTQD
jgi:sRNA-binding protein